MKRKSILGLCLLGALMISALAAQSALAISGTTLQTCVKNETAGAGFSKAHCAAADAVSSGRKFAHVAVAQDTKTEVKGTTINTAGESLLSKLKSVQSGIAVEIQSKLAHLEGADLTNKLDASGEHYFEGEGVINFTEASVTAPAGKGCVIVGGAVKTNKIKTSSTGAGDSVISEPAVAGQPFASFTVSGCAGSKALEGLNGLYNVTGKATCVPDGATLNCNEVQITEKETLKLREQKAGFEASFTLEGKDAIDGSFTPLSTTTVVT